MSEKLLGKTIKGIATDGEEYEGVVVALDYEKGITIDALDPDVLADYGYNMAKDAHMYCLNRESKSDDWLNDSYHDEFKDVIEGIQLGIHDGTKRRVRSSAMASCAFA